MEKSKNKINNFIDFINQFNLLLGTTQSGYLHHRHDIPSSLDYQVDFSPILLFNEPNLLFLISILLR